MFRFRTIILLLFVPFVFHSCFPFPAFFSIIPFSLSGFSLPLCIAFLVIALDYHMYLTFHSLLRNDILLLQVGCRNLITIQVSLLSPLCYLFYLNTLPILSFIIFASTIEHILKNSRGGEYCIKFIISVALLSFLIYQVSIWYHCSSI